MGGLSTSVTSWAFTNVSGQNSKATTVTIINNVGIGYTYGDNCTVNGSVIATGVKWVGGNPPCLPQMTIYSRLVSSVIHWSYQSLLQ